MERMAKLPDRSGANGDPAGHPVHAADGGAGGGESATPAPNPTSPIRPSPLQVLPRHPKPLRSRRLPGKAVDVSLLLPPQFFPRFLLVHRRTKSPRRALPHLQHGRVPSQQERRPQFRLQISLIFRSAGWSLACPRGATDTGRRGARVLVCGGHLPACGRSPASQE